MDDRLGTALILASIITYVVFKQTIQDKKLYRLYRSHDLHQRHSLWICCSNVYVIAWLYFGIGTGLALLCSTSSPNELLKNMGVMMGIGMLVTAVAPAVGPFSWWLDCKNILGWRMILRSPFLIVAFVLGIGFSSNKAMKLSCLFLMSLAGCCPPWVYCAHLCY